jgi:hypothetical protein
MSLRSRVRQLLLIVMIVVWMMLKTKYIQEIFFKGIDEFESERRRH